MADDFEVAPCLDQLRGQVNTLAPFRSTLSDGAKGDDKHAERKSGHNPARFAWYLKPLVLARDITHDPRGGLDCAQLAAALQGGRDRRLAYVIWNRQIMAGYEGPDPWTWRPYHGSNPHQKHAHVEALPDARCLVRSPWLLPGLGGSAQPPAAGPQQLTTTRLTLRRGDAGALVALVQRWLGVAQEGDAGYATFGPATEAAVKRYQLRHGLQVDGVVGDLTWKTMGI